MNIRRARLLNTQPVGSGPVAYWMSRDQRFRDNWALTYAMEEASKRRVPLAILFCLVEDFLGALPRQYAFMLKGLQEVEEEAARKGIPFVLLAGDPLKRLPAFVQRHKVGMVVTDFSPLRLVRRWRDGVASMIPVSCVEVDAHNVIPCWIASDHQEFAARTIRPKIQAHLSEFLEDFPRLSPRIQPWDRRLVGSSRLDVAKRLAACTKKADEEGMRQSGEHAALRILSRFLRERLPAYGEDRNDPTRDGQSGLSPYLHFGQLSAQRVALEVRASSAPSSAKDVFLEELLVRRELADNYCFYNPAYDAVDGFPAWAKKTLNEHRKDTRPFLYTRRQLEEAKTHDRLWNACQRELLKTGKMHGYMRMYWAKKILEWTKTPEEALRIAIHLNDTYEIDGRDPNGYVGIAWSLGGVHDRPWFERPVFGTIRYMSEGGARSKFDVDAYIARWE